MRKLALAVGLVALATTTPAFADGGGGPGHSAKGAGDGPFGHVFRSLWRPAFFAPPGFSHGRHFGWGWGKHWGWFKPHHPNWPHHPPHSP